jgi:ATP-dependent DNA helicase RecG
MNVRPLIRHLPENLPAWVTAEAKLVSHAEAVETIHFPIALEDLQAAKRRLAFEEAFGLTMASLLARQLNEAVPAKPITFDESVTKEFIASLPFTLTDHQRAVTWQALKDMQKTTPMNRLVEGDVGSGKTVVAAICALNAVNAGYQALFIAPTELLARQHYANLEKMLGKQRVHLLIGSHTAEQKKPNQSKDLPILNRHLPREKVAKPRQNQKKTPLRYP